MSEPTYCSNPDHTRQTPAIVHMSWPDGRYRPTTACIGDMQDHVRGSVDEGHPVLLRPVTPNPLYREYRIYLVWSNEHRTWWGPDNSGYTGDVWAAGRYDEAAASQICGTRSWSHESRPPEVMVLAPEGDRDLFIVDDIRAVPDLMQKRIHEATRRAVAERKAAKTSVPA